MTAGRVITIALAAGALALLYASCLLIFLRRGPDGRCPSQRQAHRTAWTFLVPVPVLPPLVIYIPWSKLFPAVGDAGTLFLSALLLFTWLGLYARGGADTPKDEKVLLGRALAVAVLCALIKPDMLLLPLAMVVVECLRRRRSIGPRLLAKAAGLIVLAGVVRVAVWSLVIPSAWFGLVELARRILGGLAWDSQGWILSGSGLRRVYEYGPSFGAYFYWPLLVPLIVLLYRYRREWWFVPVSAWSATIFILTIALVRKPYLAGCPALQAAMLLAFGVPALLAIGDEYTAARREVHISRRGAGSLAPTGKGYAHWAR
ncbi:MAG: hypothetical protein J7M19_04795 [Planctomycetes bacterium]|nr:hypothetical protein [Planctomycetota bacterium]